MPSPLAIAAAVGALGLLTLFAYRLSGWIAHRRQVSRTVALAAAVAEEAKHRDAAIRAIAEQLLGEVLAVDPPTSRLYIPPLDTARSMEPLPPLPPIGGVWS